MSIRYVLMQNWYTDEWFWIDSFQRRYDRMKDRLQQWNHLVDDLYPQVPGWHLTLTYDRKGTEHEVGREWEPGDMRKFLANYKRKWYASAWVMEVHRSGFPHFHVCLVADKEPAVDWDWGRMVLTGPWVKGVGYLVEHACKPEQKEFYKFPPGARFFGVSCPGKAMKIIPRDRESESSSCTYVGSTRNRMTAQLECEWENSTESRRF